MWYFIFGSVLCYCKICMDNKNMELNYLQSFLQENQFLMITWYEALLTVFDSLLFISPLLNASKEEFGPTDEEFCVTNRNNICAMCNFSVITKYNMHHLQLYCQRFPFGLSY